MRTLQPTTSHASSIQSHPTSSSRLQCSFREVSRSFEKFREVSRSFEKFREVSRSFEKFREVSRSFEKFRDTKRYFIFQNISSALLLLSKIFKCFHIIESFKQPKSKRRYQILMQPSHTGCCVASCKNWYQR